MELYDSEEQQVEAIKDWWQENGKAVVLGVVVGLGGLFGWRFYQDSAIQAQEAASEQYTSVVEAIAAQGVEAGAEVQSFIDTSKATEYSVLAALQLAKAQVEAGELDQALTQLQWAQANTKDAAVSPLVTYRIARIMAEQENIDGARAELDKITDEAWAGRVAELRGDIAIKAGERDVAYSAYTEAQQAQDASQALQIKLDDLAK
ncbi:tetratricopeptide repeat protein [Vibrio sp. ZSDZ65]|uniref:Ancillary SecYEG translocon subunit n=1 Tax=Vibrio qingdaonensis TaxID=2829491 RepID=A0A9X3HY72_9VIBR|nr:tetratricopeptide repeat protein [Vibrio qingdaonensis]MCW8347542.1 tetratricopeptide repeat protein [Vibrio qingdaonensis]